MAREHLKLTPFHHQGLRLLWRQTCSSFPTQTSLAACCSSSRRFFLKESRSNFLGQTCAAMCSSFSLKEFLSSPNSHTDCCSASSFLFAPNSLQTLSSLVSVSVKNEEKMNIVEKNLRAQLCPAQCAHPPTAKCAHALFSVLALLSLSERKSLIFCLRKNHSFFV